jgi:hypothetical protein
MAGFGCSSKDFESLAIYRKLVRCHYFRNRHLFVMEPLGRPDAVKAPSDSFELFLAQSVAIAGRLSRMECRAITFQGEDKLPRPIGVLDGEVNSVSRCAVLRHQSKAPSRQCIANIYFERIECRNRARSVAEVGSA